MAGIGSRHVLRSSTAVRSVAQLHYTGTACRPVEAVRCKHRDARALEELRVSDRSWVVTHDLGSQMLQMDDPSESMCGYC